MITLQSIRVRNFRAIKEATFKPLEEGITGIFGSNGAGKTTFLTATLFALYGVKPAGAGQNSLRRLGSKGECSVSVVFKHMNQQVEIIRELKAPNNRIVVNIYVDGVPQTVTSVGAADQWVKTRLGIDANGFMTAFVVRQKELDALVNAKPAERKAVIERLAGIDTINNALKSAREDENQAKKTLASMPGSEAEMTSASENLDLSTRRLDKASSEKEELSLKFNTLETKVNNLKVKAEAIKNDQLALQTLNTRIGMLKEQIADNETQLNSMPPAIDEELSLDELREKLREINSEIDELNSEISNVSVKVNGNAQARQAAQHELDTVESELKTFSPKPDIKIDYLAIIEANQKAIEVARDTISGCRSKIADLDESLKALAHADVCPTCQQNIKNSADIISGIKALKLDSESKLAEAEKIVEQERNNMGENNSLKNSQQEYIGLQKRLVVAQDNLNSIENIDELNSVLESLKSSLKDKSDEKDSVTERGINLKNSSANVDARNTLTSKIVELKGKLSEDTSELKVIEAKAGGEETIKELSQLTKMESELASMRTTLSDINTTYSAIEQKVATDKLSYKIAKEQWQTKKELLKKQEQLALTTDLINSFRGETIAQLAPELSEFATGLISEMTNGDFTEVRLDEEFNPSIVDRSGTERPVSWLSGGEESSVALALRIAIAFLITGGNPELLWLDEVLTAQDSDRRNTMLSMIRRLPISQIIMINHTEEAGDIVDKKVELIPDLIEGSSISEESSESDSED